MDPFSELEDIGRMLRSASFLETVRSEVRQAMEEGYVVTDGAHERSTNFEVVVRCGGSEDVVSRRLKARIPDIDVTSIAEGVLGLRQGRRTR